MPGCGRILVLAAIFALFVAGLSGPVLAAQTPSTPPASPHKTPHPHKRAKAAEAKPATAPEPAAAAVPEAPHWPVNDKASDAAITWDSHGLRIEAANSSLHKILKDVSTITGAKVEGLGPDERVFGAYGPGLARDVLSQLLQGAGYNVLMIGDQGQGAPREIVLSSRNAGEQAQPQEATPANDDDAEPDEQPEEPVPVPRNGFGPGGPRTPQQMMQEREQRMQQMQQNNNQPH
jgi:hypothetical protein